MPKTRDIPASLRDFNNTFDRLARVHDAAQCFNHFLDILINAFAPGNPALELDKIYNRRELDTFNKLFYAFFPLMAAGIEQNEWYDLLGIFYEAMASRWKASAFGQFFTPTPVCDMLAKMSSPTGPGKTVNDCACGSARLLLAYHVAAPGNILYAEDLDPVCAKMATVNLLIHGAVGHVRCMNTLTREGVRFGWHVNQDLYITGIPSLRPINTETDTYGINRKEDVQLTPAPKPAPAKAAPAPAQYQPALF